MKKYRLQITTLFLLILLPLGAYISPRLLSCEFSYPKMTLWISIFVVEAIIFSKRNVHQETLRDWSAHIIGLVWIIFWTEIVWDIYLMQQYYKQCDRKERILAAFWLGIGIIIFWLILLRCSTTQYRKHLKTM